MAKRSIPEPVRVALAGRAGGRCEYPGCNKRLDVDDLSSRPANLSACAHIVADQPGGPRGDPVRSPELAKDINNLMFLCLDHHKMIDVGAVEAHPESVLLRFKQEHEERVANLLEIQATHKTRLLFVKANIGERTVVVSHNDARAAVLPLLMYPERDDILIDLTSLAVRDNEPAFWNLMAAEIDRQARDGLRATAARPTPISVSVFGLAPIPLLMVLGRTLGNIAMVHAFQKHRVPDTWTWQEQRGDATDVFVLEGPDELAPQRDVALLLSVSGVVHEDEVHDSAPGLVPIWRISASRPQVDFLRTRALLTEFAALFRQALHDIRRVHGPGVRVHLFPAIPNSVAIECGKVLLPKADPAIRVYDRNRNSLGWAFALDLLERTDLGEPVAR